MRDSDTVDCWALEENKNKTAAPVMEAAASLCTDVNGMLNGNLLVPFCWA